MKNILPAITIFLFSQTCVRAQDNIGKISGAITDEANKPIRSVTVSLLKATDSALVKISVSGTDGKYEFEKIGFGNYFVAISSVGYNKKTSNHFSVDAEKNQVQLGILQLTPASKELGGVTVNSKKSFIEARVDKTVLNVDASPVNAGATAQELLEKAPGVSVDNDGNISLRGKAGTNVMIDGKPTFLSPTDLSNVLKNMPASAIDQIEIMTNPPARFDASGNSGIINIKTKKGKAAGFNASLSLAGTVSFFEQHNTFYLTPKTQNSITFNYRKNKFNFFGNYNPNSTRGKSILYITRTKLDQNHTILGYNIIDTRHRFGNDNQTLKLGFDFSPDKKNTYGMVVSGYAFTGYPRPRTITSFFDFNNQPVSGLQSYTRNTLHNRNILTNLNYRHQFDTTGKELLADFDLILYDNTSDVTLSTIILDRYGQAQGNERLLRGNLPAGIKIFSFKSDYTHPLKNGLRLEAGIKTSFVRNNSEVDYESWNGQKWVPDNRSNHFIYEETINAAYINLSKSLNKWTFQSGLRAENTIAKGNQVTLDSTFKRSFTKLFPTLFISRELKKGNQLSISYGKRITRPNYRDLNPFSYFLDSLSYQVGNPFLKPQVSNNTELSYAHKGKLIVTLNYSKTNDAIAQIVKANGDILLLTSDNMATLQNIGISINSSVSIRKKWNMNLYTNIFNNHYIGFYNSTPLDLSYTSFTVNMTQTYTTKKGVSIELSGIYNSKGVSDISIVDPLYIVNTGVQKTILKGKGTLRANVKDIFWSQKTVRVRQYDVVDTKFVQKNDTRAVIFSFTYRFGKSNQKSSNKSRNGASDEERSRVGG